MKPKYLLVLVLRRPDGTTTKLEWQSCHTRGQAEMDAEALSKDTNVASLFSFIELRVRDENGEFFVDEFFDFER